MAAPTLIESCQRSFRRMFDRGDILGLTTDQKLDTVRVQFELFAREVTGKNVNVELHQRRGNGQQTSRDGVESPVSEASSYETSWTQT